MRWVERDEVSEMSWARWVEWDEWREMSWVTWVESDVVSEESWVRWYEPSLQLVPCLLCLSICGLCPWGLYVSECMYKIKCVCVSECVRGRWVDEWVWRSVCERVYVNEHVWASAYVCMHVCMISYVWSCACMYMCVDVCVYVRANVQDEGRKVTANTPDSWQAKQRTQICRRKYS